jgi:phosphoribosylamine---glycine ligase
VIVGPEGPLVAGLADKLRAVDIPVFGPSARAAILEGSKGYSKDFMAKYGVPTAAYGRFTEPAKAKAFLDKFSAPYVLKADGLAAGKGVVIAATRAEAEAEIDAMLGGKFGTASASLVIEEFMEGEEPASSLFVMARPPCRWPARRTTSASAMATPDPTPAAWALTLLRRSSMRRCKRS